MTNFIQIYRWRVINQELPFNVQRFEQNQCAESKDFKTLCEAKQFAATHNLPVVENL